MRFATPRRALAAAAAVLLATLAACGGDTGTAPTPAPQPPTGITATAAGTSSIRLTWTAVTGATAYTVQRATGTGAFEQVGTPTEASFTDTGLQPNTEYRYRIQTRRGSDVSAFSADVTARTAQPGAAATVALPANITANRTLSADTTYQLTGVTFVANGATLTVPAGTRIIGGPITAGQAPPVTALVVLRGARIVATGTAALPVVMTSSAPAGQRAPGDWGGLILVGNARSNRTGRIVVEGPTPVDTVSWNGGTADNDNSGTLRYVRIEFAGAAVRLNEELNCLSMYAVGSATQVEYVQCARGLDDHFEWFGGTVDGRFLVSYESGDDHFDAAEGYRGRNQFLIGLQTGPRVPPRPGNPGALSAEQSGFEVDGCGSATGTCAQGFNSTPFTMPVFANFTLVGPGPGVLPVRPAGDGGLGANIRRGTGGAWINGVLARWPEAGLSIFDPETSTRLTEDSLDIRHIVLADNPRNYDADGASNPARFGQAARFADRSHRTLAVAANTLFQNVPAANVEIANGFALNWAPATGSPLATGGLTTLPARIAARAGNFFGGTLAGTTYVGAADPAGQQWWAGWTQYLRN